MLSKQQLDTVVKQEVESWKAALGSVAGVYLIADRRTGKLYVGSATGNGVDLAPLSTRTGGTRARAAGRE